MTARTATFTLLKNYTQKVSWETGIILQVTYNGITVNEEAVTYETSPEIIAEQQVVFTNRWGGIQP